MDMRQLRYFVQIVESGSLSQASRQLYIAQPSLSEQMAKLEDEVGKPLLVRTVRGVTPTPNGEALYHHARFMLRQLDEATLIARQEFTSIKARVTLGVAPTTVAVLGLPLLRHLKEKYPGILLNVIATHSASLEEMARASQLDVAILFSNTAASEMVHKPLLEEELFVMIPADSPLVPPRRKSLTLAETARLPLVLSNPNHQLRRRIMLEFERAQLTVHPEAEIDSLVLVMQYLAIGGGATIQPMAALHSMPPTGKWRCLGISDTAMVRTNYLYTLPVQKISAGASLVAAETEYVVRELIASGKWEGVKAA
jgi:LysR family tcuABC transcriptional regulator